MFLFLFRCIVSGCCAVCVSIGQRCRLRILERGRVKPAVVCCCGSMTRWLGRDMFHLGKSRRNQWGKLLTPLPPFFLFLPFADSCDNRSQ